MMTKMMIYFKKMLHSSYMSKYVFNIDIKV